MTAHGDHNHSIDFQINDFINEYLDYKGYNETVSSFTKERKQREEPIRSFSNGAEKHDEQNIAMKDEIIQYLDNGHRKEFFRLWSEHVPANVIDEDPSLKALEFLLYAHFAIYHLKPGHNQDADLAKENMQILEAYMDSIKGQAISQTNDILPLFALPFVPSPEKHSSFQELFSDNWPLQLKKKLENFLDWLFSRRSLPKLVELLQNGERASHLLTQLNNETEELKHRNRETNRQIKHLSTDYCNLISITMELVETLQKAIVGRTITNEYIDNVCARLGLQRLRESIPITKTGNNLRLGVDDPFTEKLDYVKIKRDIILTTPRQKSLLLQALRWKLTKAKTDFKREKLLECYITNDLLGCRSDQQQRQRVITEISQPSPTSDNNVKEEWARLINTIASLRKGRSYLAPNEQLIIRMQQVATAEINDTPTKQHLLAALQKLSLRRSVQTIMINHNIINWLIPLLSKTEILSDYTLEYAVALLMNLCLRTSGRRKCAEICEQAINVLSSLLTHRNYETRPYVNSSLYSILTVRSVREKAKDLNLDNRLRSLIQTEKTNETKGQLEFLLKLLCEGDMDGNQASDNEYEDNDDEDQDVMEADLDHGDKLKANNQELSGEQLMVQQYGPKSTSNNSNSKPYNNAVYSSSDFKSKTMTDHRTPLDPVLHRPTTPGQLRHSIAAHNFDSLTTTTGVFSSQSGGFSTATKQQTINKKSLSASVSPAIGKQPVIRTNSTTSSGEKSIVDNGGGGNDTTTSKKIRPNSATKTETNAQRTSNTNNHNPSSKSRLDSSIQSSQWNRTTINNSNNNHKSTYETPVMAFADSAALSTHLSVDDLETLTENINVKTNRSTNGGPTSPPLPAFSLSNPRSSSSASLRSSSSSTALELSGTPLNNVKKGGKTSNQ